MQKTESLPLPQCKLGFTPAHSWLMQRGYTWLASYQASAEGVCIFKQGMEKPCMLAIKHTCGGMKSCLLHDFPSEEKQGYGGTIKLVTITNASGNDTNPLLGIPAIGN